MKTKEQIIKWLEEQQLKNEFYENCFKHKTKDVIYNEDFILTAFSWGATEQGYKYWAQINKEYFNWYYGNRKPMSWDEYCDMVKPAQNSHIQLTVYTEKKREFLKCRMPDKLCEAFAAYVKLIQLRNAWIKDEDSSPCVHKILLLGDSVKVVTYPDDVKGLSFSSFETAYNFICTFKDLLEEAKPLL